MDLPYADHSFSEPVLLICCINGVWDNVTSDAPRLEKMEFFSLVSFTLYITMLVHTLFSRAYIYMSIYSG